MLMHADSGQSAIAGSEHVIHIVPLTTLVSRVCYMFIIWILLFCSYGQPVVLCLLFDDLQMAGI